MTGYPEVIGSSVDWYRQMGFWEVGSRSPEQLKLALMGDPDS